MKYFFPALQVELLKIRKSKVIWITVIAFTLVPLVAGFFMFVLKYPELAESSSLINAKSQIAGEVNWPAYLSLLAQMITVGGILIFGFVTSWLFGREYTDGTVKDLLALPYPRFIIILAKFIAGCITTLLMTVYIVLLGLLIGWLLDLPQWSIPVFSDGMMVLLIVTMLTIALSTPVAFFASFGRGFLSPLGFVILMLVLSQLIAATGFGEYFPWSIPTMYSGVVEGGMTLGWVHLSIILITAIVGLFGTLYWWLFADQH